VAFDRVLATRLGAAAVAAAEDGGWGNLVGIRGLATALTSLHDVGADPSRVPPERYEIPEVLGE
jgi:6-phosphofructokinase 1